MTTYNADFFGKILTNLKKEQEKRIREYIKHGFSKNPYPYEGNCVHLILKKDLPDAIASGKPIVEYLDQNQRVWRNYLNHWLLYKEIEKAEKLILNNLGISYLIIAPFGAGKTFLWSDLKKIIKDSIHLSGFLVEESLQEIISTNSETIVVDEIGGFDDGLIPHLTGKRVIAFLPMQFASQKLDLIKYFQERSKTEVIIIPRS